MPRKLGVLLALAALVALALLVPALEGDYYVHVFALVFTNVIVAASLRPSLTCGQLNIGHSAFMSIGAYTSALLAKNLAVPFEISLLCGALLATLVGLAIGYPSLRLRGVYFAMVTVAFVEVIRLIAQLWVSLTRGMSGLSGIPKPSVLGMTLTSRASQYYLVVGLTLVILLVLWKLEHGLGAPAEPGGLTSWRSSRRASSPGCLAAWRLSIASTSRSTRARSSA